MSHCVGSSGVGPPASAVAQHGVERGDHLAHDGDKDDLGLLAGGGEALVECFEGGVVTAISARSGLHRQHLTRLGTLRPARARTHAFRNSDQLEHSENASNDDATGPPTRCRRGD